MELKDDLEAEVREMGLEMALLDKPVGNKTPTLNKTVPPLQHCVLLGVLVKNINIMEVKQNGGPINSQAMDASLAILENLLFPQLIHNNNPNSQSPTCVNLIHHDEEHSYHVHRYQQDHKEELIQTTQPSSRQQPNKGQVPTERTKFKNHFPH